MIEMSDVYLTIKAGDLLLLLFASVGSFFLAMIFTPIMTHFQFKYQLWKKMQEESSMTKSATPVYASLHKDKHKRNIPTVAGIMIWLPVTIVSFVFINDRAETWLPIFTLVAAGILGLINDFANVFGSKKVRGLSMWEKIVAMVIITGIGAWWFYSRLGWDSIHIPAFGEFYMGVLYIPFFMLVLTATSNAVNITDGLDGLAGGLLFFAFSAFGGLAFFKGWIFLAAFCGAVAGATLAYTWFNIYPARFFMGDTGSLSLGMTLGVVAMLTDSALVLPVVGFVFVMETASVILQMFWKKFFGRKLILSSPIHYHLQAIGWPEAKVTMRLWIIGAVSAMAGLVLGLAGGGYFWIK